SVEPELALNCRRSDCCRSGELRRSQPEPPRLQHRLTSRSPPTRGIELQSPERGDRPSSSSSPASPPPSRSCPTANQANHVNPKVFAAAGSTSPSSDLARARPTHPEAR
ncbi:hypothetical protein E2562_038773, partial [Oryza meyeriana var. granulata]